MIANIAIVARIHILNLLRWCLLEEKNCKDSKVPDNCGNQSNQGTPESNSEGPTSNKHERSLDNLLDLLKQCIRSLLIACQIQALLVLLVFGVVAAGFEAHFKSPYSWCLACLHSIYKNFNQSSTRIFVSPYKAS